MARSKGVADQFREGVITEAVTLRGSRREKGRGGRRTPRDWRQTAVGPWTSGAGGGDGEAERGMAMPAGGRGLAAE